MKKTVFSILLLVLILISCRSNKASIMSDISYEISNELKVKEAFLQKEIPGQKDEKPKQYLTIQFNEASLNNEIQLDSICLQTNYYKFPPDFKKINRRFELKHVIEFNSSNQEETKPLMTTVFFTKNEQAFQQSVPLLIKSSIYLP